MYFFQNPTTTIKSSWFDASNRQMDLSLRPPGTGKTHTIANLICHAMATGERVLVVSRGEAALAVLKDQLPKEVQPLAIAVISNERQGLRQLERAIREIEAVVEGTSPEKRGSAIRRLEAEEIDGLRKRIAAIDQELDAIAVPHLSKIGPRGETAVELAHRVVADRDAFAWFTDRPKNFAAEATFSEQDITALAEARRRVRQFLDHLYADLPLPANLPTRRRASASAVMSCSLKVASAAKFLGDQ